MTKSNKILCIVSAILIAFVGLFGIVFVTQSDRIVKADSVSSGNYFVGSNFCVNLSLKKSANFNLNSDNSFFTVEKGAFVKFDIFADIVDGNYFYSDNFVRFYYHQGSMIQNGSVPISASGSSIISRNTWNTYFLQLSSSRFICYNYFCDTSFNYPIGVTISNATDVWGKSNLRGCRIDYFDSNYNHFIIVPILDGSYNSFDTRTYYFLDTSSLSDNQYYQAGKQAGLNENQQNIYDEGYQKCIDENKQNWINYGKQQGIAQANDYTFFGLIGATIDAPISALFGRLDTNPDSPTYNQYVGGFFNFELLGVNLRSFFFAILTFALIIVIIRFALAR